MFLAGEGGCSATPDARDVAIERPTDTLCQDPSRARAMIGAQWSEEITCREPRLEILSPLFGCQG
jgi:hypothetical protein